MRVTHDTTYIEEFHNVLVTTELLVTLHEVRTGGYLILKVRSLHNPTTHALLRVVLYMFENVDLIPTSEQGPQMAMVIGICKRKLEEEQIAKLDKFLHSILRRDPYYGYSDPIMSEVKCYDAVIRAHLHHFHHDEGLRMSYNHRAIDLVLGEKDVTLEMIVSNFRELVERWPVQYIAKDKINLAKAVFYNDLLAAICEYKGALSQEERVVAKATIEDSYMSRYRFSPSEFFKVHRDPLLVWRYINATIAKHIKVEAKGTQASVLHPDVIKWLNDNVFGLVQTRDHPKNVEHAIQIARALRPGMSPIVPSDYLNSKLQHGPDDERFVIKKYGQPASVLPLAPPDAAFNFNIWNDHKVFVMQLPEATTASRRAKEHLLKLMQCGPYMHWPVLNKQGEHMPCARTGIIAHYLREKYNFEQFERNGMCIVFAATGATTKTNVHTMMMGKGFMKNLTSEGKPVYSNLGAYFEPNKKNYIQLCIVLVDPFTDQPLYNHPGKSNITKTTKDAHVLELPITKMNADVALPQAVNLYVNTVLDAIRRFTGAHHSVKVKVQEGTEDVFCECDT